MSHGANRFNVPAPHAGRPREAKEAMAQKEALAALDQKIKAGEEAEKKKKKLKADAGA